MKQPNNPLRLTGFLLFAALWLCACSDVIIPDISRDRVTLVVPPDSFVTNQRTNTFRWEHLDNAKTYNLRVVSPGFDSIVSFEVDETTASNQLEITLPYGDYAWQVVAQNDGYDSDCCETRQLFIRNDSSNNLSGQTLTLLSPNNDYFTQQPTVSLEWQSLTGAEKYLLQVGNSNFSVLFLLQEQTGSNFTFTASQEGAYYWRVRGVNESSLTTTAWQQRVFTYDKTPPATPDLLFPAAGDTIKLSAQASDLTWLHAQDAALDTVFVYNNAQRDLLLLQIATSAAAISLDGTVIDQPNSLEDFYWEVLSTDKAGNRSNKSPLRRFFVKKP